MARAQVGHPVPEVRRQDLLELGERRSRRLLDAGHAPGCRRAQPDGDRHRLVVVEHQGGGIRARPQPVAAPGPGTASIG